MKTTPIYFLVDSTNSITERIKTKRNNALNLFLEKIANYESSRNHSEIAVIRMASSSRKVLSLKKPADISMPNFKSDKSGGMDLNGAFSIIENDLTKIAQPTSNYTKPKIVMFLGSKPSVPHMFLRKLSKSIDSILIIYCNSNADKNTLNKISNLIMDVEDFTNNAESFMKNWLQIKDIPSPGPIELINDMSIDHLFEEEKSLTDLIEGTVSGGTLTLMPREYRGPVNVTKPIKIIGQGATIWGISGPIVTISSENVILENLKIEVTGTIDSFDDQEKAALIVNKADGLTFRDIVVKGQVEGISEEEGKWQYPNSINLGQIKCKCINEFKIKVNVPAKCSIISNISAISIDKVTLDEGSHELTFRLEPLSPDMLLDGYVYIKSQNLKRIISLNAFISDQGEAMALKGELIWEPKVLVEEVDDQIVMDIPEELHVTDIQNTVEPSSREDSKPSEEAFETGSNDPEVLVQAPDNKSADPIRPEENKDVPLPDVESKPVGRNPFERPAQPDSSLFSIPIKELSVPKKVNQPFDSGMSSPPRISPVKVDSKLFEESAFSIPVNSKPAIENKPFSPNPSGTTVVDLFGQSIEPIRKEERGRVVKRNSVPISNLFLSDEKTQETKGAGQEPIFNIEKEQPKVTEQIKKRNIVKSQIPTFFEK